MKNLLESSGNLIHCLNLISDSRVDLGITLYGKFHLI